MLSEQLDREAAALGKSRREYIIHILSLRAAQLLKGEIQVPSKPSGKSKR